MRRRLTIIVLLLAMVGFGVGVNRYIAAHKTDLTKAVAVPTQTRPVFALPGTIYIAQGGQIYALANGSFTQLPLPNNGKWMQPHVLPDGTILAVARSDAYSDLYRVDAQGHVVAQLTHNHVSDKYIPENHWVFWPTASADGVTIFASYDLPKPAMDVSYQEDLSVWAGTTTKLNATRWTIPDPYTGGDTKPQALPDGSLLYATYSLAPTNHIVSTIVIQKTPHSSPVLLTAPDDDCNSPTVAADGVTIAMICTKDSQTAKLEVAHLVKGKLATPTVVVDGCLCNSPAWAPDASGLLYLAPSDATGHFQLWWLKGAGTATPDAPRQVSDGSIDLDATSAPAWLMPAAPSVAAAAPTPS